MLPSEEQLFGKRMKQVMSTAGFAAAFGSVGASQNAEHSDTRQGLSLT